MTNGIAFLAAAVAGIAFQGVDISVLYPFHDTNMVGTSILSVRVRVVPIKEDDVAGARLIAAVLPQTVVKIWSKQKRKPAKPWYTRLRGFSIITPTLGRGFSSGYLRFYFMGKTGFFLLIHSPALGSQEKCTQFVLSPLQH